MASSASLQLVNRRKVKLGASSGERSSSFTATGMDEPRRDLRRNLTRMLSPKTVAVVGANDQSPMSNNVVLPMLEAGHDVVLVNPRRDEAYGRPVVVDLASAGRPIDAVLSIVNAEASLTVVEEAAALGCGGVVVVASGFAETGPEGVEAQERLAAIADRTSLAVVGPNCAGFRNVALGVSLFTGGRLDVPVAGAATVGGVSIVSQSGFLARAAAAAARERALGVSIVVSSGNEAVCDLADFVAVAAADPFTSVICVVVETLRRPADFFASVGVARDAGKPVVALKLGRSARARTIMQSHTGAIADEGWVYDLAFREHGVIDAADVDDLLDRAQLFAQLPRERHRPIRSIGVIAASGGVAALAADIADASGAPVPPLDEIAEWVRERVPGDTVNPLDLTGFVFSRADLMQEVFAKYASVVDLLVLGWWAGDGDADWSGRMLEPLALAAADVDTPVVVSPVEATSIGAWVTSWRDRGVMFGRGIESVFHAADALDRFVAGPLVTLASAGDDQGDEPAPGAAPELIATAAGPMVPFAEAMALLTRAGIPVAPWEAVAPDAPAADLARVASRVGSRLVVKLANVPHRTELDAVRVDVAVEEVEHAIAELRAIAGAHQVDATVAIQAMVSGHAEAFAGVHCGTGLGDVLLFGRGGVLVELTDGVAGRFLPVDAQRATELAREVAGPEVIAGIRGQRPWPLASAADVIRGLDRLWRTHRHWMSSLDVNPLIVTEDGLVAVDALFLGDLPKDVI